MASPTPSSDHARLTRRSLAIGSAWAIPTIAAATAAPAFAASPCTPTTSFDSLVVGTQPATIRFEPTGTTARLSYTSSGQGNDSTPGITGRVSATTASPPWNYIALEMVAGLTAGDSVSLLLQFSKPVEGLSFLLHDIDSVSGGYVDTVEVAPTGFTYQLGSNVQGAGTAKNRFRPIEWGDTPIVQGAGRVRLSWAGPVSSVTIKYVAGMNGKSTNQHIGLGDLSYNACVVAGARSLTSSREAVQTLTTRRSRRVTVGSSDT